MASLNGILNTNPELDYLVDVFLFVAEKINQRKAPKISERAITACNSRLVDQGELRHQEQYAQMCKPDSHHMRLLTMLWARHGQESVLVDLKRRWGRAVQPIRSPGGLLKVLLEKMLQEGLEN